MANTNASVKKKNTRNTVLRVLLYVVIIAICLITLYPYFVTVCTALKSRAEIFSMNGTIFPVEAIWSNFTDVWKLAPMSNYMMNSIVIAGGSTLLAMVCGIPAAYALSRMKFKGQTAFLGFVIFSIICSLAFVRVDRKHAVILIVTAVMFYLKLEYLLPVLLGMIVGFGAILPAAAGVVVYFLSVYMTDVSTLLTTSSSSSFGMGLQRIVNLMLIDKKLLVFLITFSLIIFITTLLCHLFYERAWLFAIFIGHIAMILLLLFGRLIFELDYKIWRLFLEMILGIGCCYIYRFFRGIGDVSRIEKASFEDDEYFYYVKAVPKIKVTQKDRNVTDIKSGENEDDILFDDITEETDLFDGNREEAEKE